MACQGSHQYTGPTGAPDANTCPDSALWPGLLEIVSEEAWFKEDRIGIVIYSGPHRPIWRPRVAGQFHDKLFTYTDYI